jgi:hypothetical protein
MQDIRSADLRDRTFHRFGLTGGFVTATLHCSRCGHTHQMVSLPMYTEDTALASLLQRIYQEGWRSDGSQILCQSCSATGQPPDWHMPAIRQSRARLEVASGQSPSPASVHIS